MELVSTTPILKVYVIGFVMMHQGEFVEYPFFSTAEKAIEHVEQNIIPSHVNCSYRRVDNELDEHEIARWYECYDEAEHEFPITDHYRIMEREVV